MSLVCPQCSQVNQESTGFCRKCGYHFQQGASEGTVVRPASLAGLPADADPGDTLKPPQSPVVAQPTPVMVAPPIQQAAPNTPVYEQSPMAANPGQPSGPFFSQGQAAPIQGQAAYFPQQQQPVYAQYPGQPVYGGMPIAQPVPASPSALSTLQRGFAGKGTPIHHQSWLLENKQTPLQALNSAFITNLQKQNVMGVVVEPERLREQGAVMEERDYIKVRYGASSIFVYMAPMGQNLYVSRTSTIHQPYSKIRMVVLIALAVLMLISLILYAVINPVLNDPFNPGAYGLGLAIKNFFFYAFYGLLFFYIIAVLRSLIFWFTDKDFLAILRPNRLNDFSLDALASIERTTDKALRMTLQDAGLDADVIELAHYTTPQQALHRI